MVLLLVGLSGLVRSDIFDLEFLHEGLALEYTHSDQNTSHIVIGTSCKEGKNGLSQLSLQHSYKGSDVIKSAKSIGQYA